MTTAFAFVIGFYVGAVIGVVFISILAAARDE